MRRCSAQSGSAVGALNGEKSLRKCEGEAAQREVPTQGRCKKDLARPPQAQGDALRPKLVCAVSEVIVTGNL